MEKNNHSDIDVIIGFILGFGAFYLYDLSKDKKRRDSVIKDLHILEDKIKPYIAEFQQHLKTSNKLQSAIEEIDNSLGTNLKEYLENYKKNSKTVELTEDRVSKTTSIKRFFGIE